MPVRMLRDSTAEDLLRFDRYLSPLVSVLTDRHTETPLVIGVFGAWGSGKTTLLRLLDEELDTRHRDRFVRVWFNPWIHRGEPNMLVPLLHTIHDALFEDRVTRFKDSATKIWDVLVRLGANLALKAVTANAVSVDDLEKLEKRYLDERARVTSEMRKLRTTLKAVAESVAERGAKLLIIVDDLDRCEPTDIVNVLESVKLFLDVEHVFVILAMDKEVIDRGIQVRYEKFDLGKDRRAALGAEYLEKMVQLPLQLFPVSEGQVGDFLGHLNLSDSLLQHSELLRRIMPRSPRKIKRILNILSVSSSIALQTELEDVDVGLLARLVVLQVQSADLYDDVVRLPELLGALEQVYAGKLRLDRPNDFLVYKDKRDVMYERCKQYYRPDSYLRYLFEGAPFGTAGEQLPQYMSMLWR